MKKVLEINGAPYGSTATIAYQIKEVARTHDISVDIAHGFSRHPLDVIKDDGYQIVSMLDAMVSLGAHILTGMDGCFNLRSTYDFINHIRRIDYDLIHLHNLHGNYINLSMLFNYIKSVDKPVVWTLHDCWSFTGRCPHFDMVECDRWRYGCGSCKMKRGSYDSLLDTSALMWKKKKNWFLGVKDMTIITPSRWLADLVEESYLGNYPIKVIYNGIDMGDFREYNDSEKKAIRRKYGISPQEKVILGVSYGWSKRKGLDVFNRLAKSMPKGYRYVLVGADRDIQDTLDSHIDAIEVTNDRQELAELYSMANVFVNPSREDVFSLVNAEALACGTPVVMFRTGGMPEVIDSHCGIVVEKDDIEAMAKAIQQVCEDNPFDQEKIRTRAKLFAKEHMTDEYLGLYEEKMGVK